MNTYWHAGSDTSAKKTQTPPFWQNSIEGHGTPAGHPENLKETKLIIHKMEIHSNYK